MNETEERTTAIAKLKDLLKGINIVMFTTTRPDGSLRSRPMTVLQIEGTEQLWFFTHSDSQKLGEIEEHAEINLSYMTEGGDRYVSISGTASVSNEREKIRQLWNPLFKAFYPGGADDPHIVLLQMEVHDAEYWDVSSSTMVRIAGLVKAVASGQRYQPATNRKLNL